MVYSLRARFSRFSGSFLSVLEPPMEDWPRLLFIRFDMFSSTLSRIFFRSSVCSFDMIELPRFVVRSAVDFLVSAGFSWATGLGWSNSWLS